MARGNDAAHEEKISIDKCGRGETPIHLLKAAADCGFIGANQQCSCLATSFIRLRPVLELKNVKCFGLRSHQFCLA